MIGGAQCDTKTTEQRTEPSASPVRVGILGAGGLGKAAAQIIGMKRELQLCAVCDHQGYLVSWDGLNPEAVASAAGDLVTGYARGGCVSEVGKQVEGCRCEDAPYNQSGR